MSHDLMGLVFTRYKGPDYPPDLMGLVFSERDDETPLAGEDEDA
jgi:hypothetical protein